MCGVAGKIRLGSLRAFAISAVEALTTIPFGRASPGNQVSVSWELVTVVDRVIATLHASFRFFTGLGVSANCKKKSVCQNPLIAGEWPVFFTSYPTVRWKPFLSKVSGLSMVKFSSDIHGRSDSSSWLVVATVAFRISYNCQPEMKAYMTSAANVSQATKSVRN